MNLGLKKIFIIVAGATLALSANAAYLIGSNSSQGGLLQIFNTEDNSVTTLASSLPNGGKIEGLTYAGHDTLYGILNKNNNSILYKFVLNANHTDFSTVEIGNVANVSQPNAVTYINGTLYVHNNLNSAQEYYTDLYAVNPETAETTLISRYDVRKEVMGSAPAGELEYYIETPGANETTIGYFDYSVDGAPTDTDNVLTITGDKLQGLAYTEDTLYGISNDGVYRINLGTGTYQNIYSGWGNNIQGLTAIGGVGGIVPEPTAVLSFILIAGAGIWIQRKMAARKA
jgi:hypothetical protein